MTARLGYLAAIGAWRNLGMLFGRGWRNRDLGASEADALREACTDMLAGLDAWEAEGGPEETAEVDDG